MDEFELSKMFNRLMPVPDTLLTGQVTQHVPAGCHKLAKQAKGQPVDGNLPSAELTHPQICNKNIPTSKYRQKRGYLKINYNLNLEQNYSANS